MMTARIVWSLITDDASLKFLPYQLWMVVYWTTMVMTGDGELGFGSGEGAWRDGYHFQGRQQGRKLTIGQLPESVTIHNNGGG